MPLLNYTTSVSAPKTAAEIRAILVAHKAKSILENYGKNGELESLSFFATTPYGDRSFKLPVNTEAVYSVLCKQIPSWAKWQKYSEMRPIGPHEQKLVALNRVQTERVAWRIMKDWVEAQMAILEAGMVTLDQVFLPYMVTPIGSTVYESLCSGRLQLEGPR